MKDLKKMKEYEEYIKVLEKVNAELEKYGEHIPEHIYCSRSFLLGILDRLVYDKKVMSRREARRIEALLEEVKTPFELKYVFPDYVNGKKDVC